MQVVLQTQTELVVHDGRWTTVLMGAIFSAMGGGVMWLRWTHPTGWSGNAGPWLVYLIGSVFVVVGVVIFWFSADRRYIVDRSAGEPHAADIRVHPRPFRLALQLDRSRAAPPGGAGAETPGAGGEQRMSALSEVT